MWGGGGGGVLMFVYHQNILDSWGRNFLNCWFVWQFIILLYICRNVSLRVRVTQEIHDYLSPTNNNDSTVRSLFTLALKNMHNYSLITWHYSVNRAREWVDFTDQTKKKAAVMICMEVTESGTRQQVPSLWFMWSLQYIFNSICRSWKRKNTAINCCKISKSLQHKHQRQNPVNKPVVNKFSN